MAGTKNVYQRIAAVMEEAKYVQKTGYNAFHKYKYAKESDYIETLRPSLIKHGLVVVPANQTVTKDGEITTVEITFRIVNADNPSEFVEVPSAGQGQDKGDKGVYKAITGAKKYFLSLAFLIETGDDAEADESVDRAAESKAPMKPSESVAAAPAAAASAPVVPGRGWRKAGAPAAGAASNAKADENPYN